MRTLHRWLGLVLGLILAVVAATGLYLQFEPYFFPRPEGPSDGGGPSRGVAVGPPVDVASAPVHIERALALAVASAGDADVGAIELRRTAEGRVQATVTFTGASAPRAMVVDLESGGVSPAASEGGAPRGPGGAGRELHEFIQHLHTGEQFGPVGKWIGIVSGFALVFFSISGLVLYFEMLSRRAQQGRKAPFW